MATWQFDCALFPRPVAELSRDALLELLENGSRAFWSSERTANFLSLLKSIEEVRPTWSSSTTMIGVEDGTCLTVAVEEGVVDEVRLRIDMRHPRSELLSKIVDAARQCGLVLITENAELVDSDITELMKAASHSDGAR